MSFARYSLSLWEPQEILIKAKTSLKIVAQLVYNSLGKVCSSSLPGNINHAWGLPSLIAVNFPLHSLILLHVGIFFSFQASLSKSILTRASPPGVKSPRVPLELFSGRWAQFFNWLLLDFIIAILLRQIQINFCLFYQAYKTWMPVMHLINAMITFLWF